MAASSDGPPVLILGAAGQLGETMAASFGREWPTPDELVSRDDPDPLAGWYATETETAAGIVDLYRRVQAFADETIDTLPLDTVGRVPWWRTGEVTLFPVIDRDGVPIGVIRDGAKLEVPVQIGASA